MLGELAGDSDFIWVDLSLHERKWNDCASHCRVVSIFWIILCWGAVLCIAGGLPASLVSTRWIPVATPPHAVTTKNISKRCLKSLGGKNHPQLRTRAVEATHMCVDTQNKHVWTEIDRSTLFFLVLIGLSRHGFWEQGSMVIYIWFQFSFLIHQLCDLGCKMKIRSCHSSV